MQLLFASLLAMSVSMLLIPLLKRKANTFGFMDQPDARKVHAAPIPRVGGIAIGISILIATLFWAELTDQLQVMLLAMTLLWFFGVLDDRFSLSSAWKFFGQIVATLIVVYWGGLRIESLFFNDVILLPEWLSVLMTTFVVVGSTNAFNLSDGLDGLAGGAALICLGGMLLLALLGNSMQVALLCVIVIGALLGFLRFNTHPAQIFMGDSGSQLLGFSLSLFAILLTQDPYLPYSQSLPLILLGIPVIDTLMVMMGRVLQGKSPFVADRNHIHHRLLEIGFDHHEAVMVIYFMQLCMVMAAWQLRYHSDLLLISLFTIIFSLIVLFLYCSRKFKFRLRKNNRIASSETWLHRQIFALKENTDSILILEKAIGLSVSAYFILLIINNSLAPIDIGYLGLILGLFLLAVMHYGHRFGVFSEWINRGVLYVTVLIAVSIDRSGLIPRESKYIIEAIIFLFLAISIGLKIYLSLDRRYEATPLDFLVLLVALVLPNLPGTQLSLYASGWFVVKVLLLFYAVEVLSSSVNISKNISNFIGLLFLGWLGLGVFL